MRNHAKAFHIDCAVFGYHLRLWNITTTRSKGVWEDGGVVGSPLCLSGSRMKSLYGELDNMANEKEIVIVWLADDL